MKELTTLLHELHNYPPNSFIIPSTELGDGSRKNGLVVCDKDGVLQGYIDIGTYGEVITKIGKGNN
jgi:hypothetical protein